MSTQDELRRLARAWRRSQELERRRMAELAAGIARAMGEMSEAEIVRVTGVNRVTVRKAMGKDGHSLPLAAQSDSPQAHEATRRIDRQRERAESYRHEQPSQEAV